MSAPDNPMAVVVDGIQWRPFSVEFDTDEGTFSVELFAVSWTHAQMRLDDLKATGRVVGEIHATGKS